MYWSMKPGVLESSKSVIMSATGVLLPGGPGRRPGGCPQEGAVAHELEALPGEVGHKPDGDGVLQVDEAAEGPRQDDLLDVLEF